MKLLGDLLSLFDRRERWRLGVLSLLLFFGSLLEVAGIGIILPFIKIVGDPASVLVNPRFHDWFARAGIHTPRALTLSACAGLLILSLFKGAYAMVTMRLAYGFIYTKVLSLQNRLLDSYLRAPYLMHLRDNTARLVKNTTFEPEAVGGVLKSAVFLPTEFLVVAGLLAVLFATEPVTALVGIATLGTLMWGVAAISRKELSRLGKDRAEQHARMIQWVNQSLGGIKEVKLLGRERFFTDALATCGRQYVDALRRSTLISQYPRVILESSAMLLIVVFVISVVLSGRDMKSVVGVLALFGMAIVRLVPSATRITASLHGMRFYAESVTAVAEGLRAAEQSTAPISPGAPITFTDHIEIQSLSFRYPDAMISSLDNVSFEIARGSCVAFVGSSGAGKSTLANLILGLFEPTAGRILVDGADIRENLRAWQDRLGYIPQDIYLLDDTIRRNVAFGLKDEAIDDEAVWRALEAAQLAGFVRDLGEGLDAMVGERGARISAGQRQRIGIARALYHDPPVLLLDEATSALDNETERLFAAAIHALAGHKTILIIAHRLSTVRDCDTIYYMEAGRVVAAGTFTELLATQPGFAQQVHGRQPELAAR